MVVGSQSAATHDETLAAVVDGLATVKRQDREGEQLSLVEANATLVPQEVTGREVAIRGVVVGGRVTKHEGRVSRPRIRVP